MPRQGNELPRAYARGIFLFKQLRCLASILVSLILDITSDSFFVDSDGGNKVSFRPNTVASPVYVFKKGNFCFNASRCVCFDKTNNTSNTCLRWYRYEYMYVVFIMIYLFEEDFRIVVCYFKKFLLYILE